MSAVAKAEKTVKKNHAQIHGVGQVGAYTCPPEKLVIVKDRKHNLFQIRALLEPDEALVQDMVTKGWLRSSFVLVRVDEDKRLLVAEGRQRVNAAIEANRRRAEAGLEPIEVQYAIEKSPDDVSVWQRMQAANMRVHYSAIDIAEAIMQGTERGVPADQIAVMISACSGRKIAPKDFARYTKLLECSAATRRAVAEGTVSESAARAVAHLTASEQAERLADAGLHDASRGTMAGIPRARIRALVEAFDPDDERLADAGQACDALRWVLGLSPVAPPSIALLIQRADEDAAHAADRAAGPLTRPCASCGKEGEGRRRRRWMCRPCYEKHAAKGNGS